MLGPKALSEGETETTRQHTEKGHVASQLVFLDKPYVSD